MEITILFPADYFDLTKVDEQFEAEYKEAIKLPEFNIAFYNHDAFVEGAQLRVHPEIEGGLCMARTWMLKPEEYSRLFSELSQIGARLINSPHQYSLMHLFPNIYPQLSDATPQIVAFSSIDSVNVDIINRHFEKFMIKDSVKSVKEWDFPKYFETPISADDLNEYLKRFVELRGNLYTGSIVFKEYIDLKHYEGKTNEYRVFYFYHHIVSISPNSNQPEFAPYLPGEVARKYAGLGSLYYTVDFGETEQGSFIILETGDGQVSGLSPIQHVFKYYDEIRHIAGKHVVKQ